ncbi:MAG: hypothetical protein F4186_09030 [Boseongicola sp. SB0676_bin_33]|nr:hypothetical protein [Boseongicola sp. SB0676_bin_33]
MGSVGCSPFNRSASGIAVCQESQACLTCQTIGFLLPILDAQLASILESEVIVKNESQAERAGTDLTVCGTGSFNVMCQGNHQLDTPVETAIMAGSGSGGSPLTAKALWQSVPPRSD